MRNAQHLFIVGLHHCLQIYPNRDDLLQQHHQHQQVGGWVDYRKFATLVHAHTHIHKYDGLIPAGETTGQQAFLALWYPEKKGIGVDVCMNACLSL